MKLGGRDLRKIAKAVLRTEHYRALGKMKSVYESPVEMLARYLTGRGGYPCQVKLKTPLGPVEIILFSHHDLLSVNEIFCREDYAVATHLRTVVDFGSNIGISALFFLTRNQHTRLKLYEPLPWNVEKLKVSLRGFEDRYTIDPVAIGLENGPVEFAYEPSGRYGGIAKPFSTTLKVPCRAANDVFAGIFTEAGFEHIDLVKIDIEGLEARVVGSLEPTVLSRIEAIVAEVEGPFPKLPGFVTERYGPTVRWRRAPRS